MGYILLLWQKIFLFIYKRILCKMYKNGVIIAKNTGGGLQLKYKNSTMKTKIYNIIL